MRKKEQADNRHLLVLVVMGRALKRQTLTEPESCPCLDPSQNVEPKLHTSAKIFQCSGKFSNPKNCKPRYRTHH